MSYEKFVIEVVEEFRRIPTERYNDIEKKMENLLGKNKDNKTLENLLSEIMNDATKYYEGYVTGMPVKDIVEEMLMDMEDGVEIWNHKDMEFEQFADELRKELMIQVENRNIEVRFSEVFKNGGIRHAVNLSAPDSNIGIALYMEDGYRSYQMGSTVDKIADHMVSVYEEEQKRQKIPQIPNSVFQMENIVPVLLPRKGNEEMFRTIPHIPFENLEITFKFNIPEIGMATVSNKFMESKELTAEKLLNFALNNPAYKSKITITPMGEAIEGLVEDLGIEIDRSTVDVPMLVLANESNFYGAAAILDVETMQKVTQLCGEEVYILPSSLHECLAIGKSNIDIEELREMVRDINMSVLEPEEWLSDDVYQYDSTTRKISLVSEHPQIEMNNSYNIGRTPDKFR